MAEQADIAIVGGGLAGGLIALAVRRAQPNRRVVLLEAGKAIGGNHRWSWFESDLGADAQELLAVFDTTAWNGGYEVRFPAHSRCLETQYRSLASADFAKGLTRELTEGTIRTDTRVKTLTADGVTLEGGDRIAARIVIDCRNFVPTRHLAGGWQVFMGRHFRLKAPHGLNHPVIMDAHVEQHDAYRFVYSLPLSEREIFVEDTYYADKPDLDQAALEQRIDAYCKAQGWSASEEIGTETGVLPVITHGDISAHRDELRTPGVALAGARGGFVHPLTSYTLPFAAANALTVARNAALPGPDLAALLAGEAEKHWRKTRFHRALGRMLFRAEPESRYRIFERFYRLPAPLIERFYAARSTLPDKARVLTGKPPMPIHTGLAALLGKGTPLVQDRFR